MAAGARKQCLIVLVMLLVTVSSCRRTRSDARAKQQKSVLCIERDRPNTAVLLILVKLLVRSRLTAGNLLRPLKLSRRRTLCRKSLASRLSHLPTFSSLSFYKPTTVEAKSSLTGLPALMSFQQQMGRGWLGPTVRVDPQTMISTASQIAMLTRRGETPHLDMIVANSQLLG
jgi:hypothetical protein